MSNRVYHEFTYREAVFRICCDRLEAVTAEIVSQRHILENYIRECPEFRAAMSPVDVPVSAPDVARRMARAAWRVGVGPMAAVAGCMAQLAAEAGLGAGSGEAIIENGGDIYLSAKAPVVMGLYAGGENPCVNLAFQIEPGDMPLAVCSSSGKMGHSTSLGRCDLATVVAADGALADAAATQAANLVQSVDDIDRVLTTVNAIDGVDGVLIAHEGRVGLAGRLPRLVRRG